MEYDRICLLAANDGHGEPLLEPVIAEGKRVGVSKTLQEIRACFNSEWEKLPENLKEIRPRQSYPVAVCESLRELDGETAQQKRQEEVEAALPVPSRALPA